MKFVDQLLERLHSRAPARRNNDASTRNVDIAKTIHDALGSAGLEQSSAQGGQITRVINDALARAGLLGADGASASTNPGRFDSITPKLDSAVDDRLDASASPQGQFLSRTFTSPAGALAYKLYVPGSYSADATAAVPLLVMLHGCTQSPDDFAAGTRMNALSERHGFLVAYPSQSAKANANKCWNWFRPQDQARGGGEPALLAGMTAQLGVDYRVDPARIYVAGLSAGAAMAVVLGRTYPDVFAAVGAHSGLPYQAARDMGSAFAAMRNGAAGAADTASRAASAIMPTIVFHGDRDQTVAAANGDAIVAEQTGKAGLASTQERGTSQGGRGFKRTVYADASGRSLVEDWRIDSGGHAWMGGSATGSYTDPQGVDASVEILRFFLQHVR
ncbi:MAG: PHB depolymerase family esterase [Thermomonas sp.]